MFNECIGPKNTDHTLSYITRYITKSGKLPSWVRRVHIFMDNAGSTNKNAYTMSWALEMVQHRKLDFIRISFMIAEDRAINCFPEFRYHTTEKTFSTPQSWHPALDKNYADTLVEHGEIVQDWREPLKKYTKLHGIRNLHFCAEHYSR